MRAGWVWQGGVSLAQSYEALFKHRMRNGDSMTELNNQLMSAIKAQDVRGVVEALNQGASPNFKEEVPDAVLSTPRKIDSPKSPGQVHLAPLPPCAAPRSGAGAAQGWLVLARGRRGGRLGYMQLQLGPLVAACRGCATGDACGGAELPGAGMLTTASGGGGQEAAGKAKATHLWTPLMRACSARIDTGDLGMNFIACNQIIEGAVPSRPCQQASAPRPLSALGPECRRPTCGRRARLAADGARGRRPC